MTPLPGIESKSHEYPRALREGKLRLPKHDSLRRSLNIETVSLSYLHPLSSLAYQACCFEYLNRAARFELTLENNTVQ